VADLAANLHGAQPVPVSGIASAHWISREPATDLSQQLCAVPESSSRSHIPEDRREARTIASRPLSAPSIVPVVGVEGGAGRTTVTRLLGRAAVEARGLAAVAAVDAVPLWGGLTAAVAEAEADSARLTIDDVLTMAWPPREPVEEVLAEGFAHDGTLPTLTSGSSPWAGRATALDVGSAVRRLADVVELSLVDTVADPLTTPVGELVMDDATTPIWVCRATRAGLWGVAEAIAYIGKCVDGIVARSVIAVVGHGRRWPAEAKAAETQLLGSGYEIIRMPFALDPMRSQRCANAAMRLLASVVTRAD
jgi:hypothetical protein